MTAFKALGLVYQCKRLWATTQMVGAIMGKIEKKSPHSQDLLIFRGSLLAIKWYD